MVRPLCGVESHTAHTLEASFRLDYPNFELLFCVAQSDDPVAPLVQNVMRQFPQVRARLLVGEDLISDNPKLNNMAKGWREARFDCIVFADSNLMTPPDYLARLVAAWGAEARTGLVSAPPIGSDATDFWGELECAFLNPYEARWQYVVDSFGFGFAQGKTLFYRRSLLPGGIEALACEPAEDAATTKVLRSAGLQIRLATPPCFQPLGTRTFAEVWSRQVRWARLRRATFPLLFAPEILTSAFGPAAVAAIAASSSSWPVLPTVLSYLFVWYAAEIALIAACGWALSWRSPLAVVARDALIPVLWASALTGRGFVWKGQPLQTGKLRASRKRAPSIVRRLDTRRSDASRLAPSSYEALFQRLPSADRARAKMASAMRRIRRSDQTGG